MAGGITPLTTGELLERLYDRQTALREGWEMAIENGAIIIQAVNSKRFPTDQDAVEHVTHLAWCGSRPHSRALGAMNDKGREISGVAEIHRREAEFAFDEKQRYSRIEKWVNSLPESDPGLAEAAKAAVDQVKNALIIHRGDIGADRALHDRESVSRALLRSFMIALHETRDADQAREQTLQRLMITAKPHHFFRKPEADPAPSP